MDKDLFFLIFNLNGRNLLLDQLMIFGTTSLIYLTILLTLILAIKGGIKEKKAFLLLILAIPIAIILIKTIHIFYFEARPFVDFNFLPIVPEDVDASFPSRHATIASVIAFAYTYLKSKWAFLLLPVMLWIGISRIYVGVHYPLDVLGGLATGLLSLILAMQIKKLLRLGFLR